MHEAQKIFSIKTWKKIPPNLKKDAVSIQESHQIEDKDLLNRGK